MNSSQASHHSRTAMDDDDDNNNNNDGHRGYNAPPLDPAMVATCVVELGPRVCFATYDEESNEIILEETACSGNEFGIVAERYLAFVRPNLLLVPPKIVSNDSLLEALTKPLAESNIGEEDDNEGNGAGNNTARGLSGRSIPYRMLKSGAFDSRNCMQLILQKLRVLSLLRRAQQQQAQNALPQYDPMYEDEYYPHFTADNQRAFPVSNYHMMGTVIDLDSELQIKCVGALLSFLQSTIFKLEADETVTVANIVHAQSSMYMNISDGAVEALHVFSTEHHPLMAAKGRGNSKEGSSIFSLLDRTCSRGGRQMLRNWMLKPLLDRDEIIRRQDGVELFTDTSIVDSESFLGVIISLLKEIAPINQILLRMQKCTVLPIDFVKLTRTLSAASEICSVLSNNVLASLRAAFSSRASPEEGGMEQDQQEAFTPAVAHRRRKADRYIAFIEGILERCNVPVLRSLEERISSIVDEESTSEAADTVCIRPGFHEELDELKERYSGLDEELFGICQQIMAKYPVLGPMAVVFVPQVGFLIGLEVDPATGEIHGSLPPDFKHVCDNEDGHSYFKSNEMNVLDTSVGDIDGLIKDTEAMIMSDLEDDVLDQETELRETFLALSELDCILSFAVVAKDRNYIRPTILASPPDGSGSTIIKIKNGRHPLQEILVEGNFVPNDIQIDGTRLVNVLTGPNFSGKSCYARQVGALVYMCHIGSFVPCDECSVSIVDQIFTQFARIETCAVPQSSFQLDLTQMGTIFRRCTPRSLIIIDEFGKGTSPSSGIALLVSALRGFASKNIAVVCTTHFLEMFTHSFLVDGENGINAMQMAVHVPNDQEDTATPLFRLQEGVASSSAGIICARMAGLDKNIVSRAKQVVASLKAGRQIEPSVEVFQAEAARNISPEVQRVLGYYFSVPDWANASDQDVKTLIAEFETLRRGDRSV